MISEHRFQHEQKWTTWCHSPAEFWNRVTAMPGVLSVQQHSAIGELHAFWPELVPQYAVSATILDFKVLNSGGQFACQSEVAAERAAAVVNQSDCHLEILSWGLVSLRCWQSYLWPFTLQQLLQTGVVMVIESPFAPSLGLLMSVVWRAEFPTRLPELFQVTASFSPGEMCHSSYHAPTTQARPVTPMAAGGGAPTIHSIRNSNNAKELWSVIDAMRLIDVQQCCCTNQWQQCRSASLFIDHRGATLPVLEAANVSTCS
jgi:hypothetical protein